MKMRINEYACTNPNCSWRGPSRYGSTTITHREDGEVNVKCEDYGCPWCGSEVEFKSYIAETYLYNSCQPA
jgi:hypothetical protein